MNAAILLAAGASTRMGRPKQLLDWGGRPLLAAQVEALLAADCAPVIVVLGAHEPRVRAAVPDHPAVRWISNRAWREGRAGSIRAGARAIPPTADGVFVASVDSPCSVSAIRICADAFARNSQACITVPRHEGRNGHPPLFRIDLLPELRSVTERGQGIRELRRRHSDCTIFVDSGDPLCLLNLNTPESYQRALKLSTLPASTSAREPSPRC